MEWIALGLILGAVGIKVITAQMISRMRHQITHVTHMKQESLKRLKVAQSQHAVFGQNKVVLDAKKMKMLKRLKRLNSEMATINREEETRKKRTGERKIDR